MRRIRALLVRRDEGIALPVVLMLSVIMMIAVASGLSIAVSGLRQTATDQDRTGAYDAAQAGVQDYLVRINADSTYGQYGNPAAVFSAGSSLALPTGANANPAFGLGATGGWAQVQTGNTPVACPAVRGATPCFRYEVDNRSLGVSGIVRLRSTGVVGQTTRSVVVNIKRRGFVNYLYFTDYETQDPAISGRADCEQYAWAAPASSPRSDACTIQFAATDVLSGAVHSNDVIAICGATFKRAVTTANPGTPVVRTVSGCSAGKFLGGDPTRVSKIDMPDTNSAMSSQTRSDLNKTPGCLYTGPTVVKYLGDGTMTVWSPWTKFTNTTSTSGSNPLKCGTPGTDPGQLGSASGANVPQLAMNLLYVQTVRAAPDPNYSATTSIPAGMTCYGPDGTTPVRDATASVGWKFGPWSFPMAGEAAPDGWDSGKGLSGSNWTPNAWSTTTPAYNCRNGDLFVSGKVTTQTTAASENFVYIIDDITYDDPTKDVLGLVGNNAVLIWNPVNSRGQNLLAADTDRVVDAALLSVAHTFQVQNFNLGSARGTLTVLGSIAQKFRGPVATSSGGTLATGYRKDYQYDDLLATVSPPYFLAPASTTFVPKLFMSSQAAFNADGSTR